MRRTVVFIAAVLFAPGLVAGQGTPGEPGASRTVGPNGTVWTAEVSVVGRSQARTGDEVFNVSYSGIEKKVSFSGRIQAPTPCHVVEHEVERENGSYVMDLETVRAGNPGGKVCTQVITGISYDASFKTDRDFVLEVHHNGEHVETLEYPETGTGRKGYLEKFFSWLLGLF